MKIILKRTKNITAAGMDSIIDAYGGSSDEEGDAIDLNTQKMNESVTKAINYDSNEARLRLSLAPINPDAQAYV